MTWQEDRRLQIHDFILQRSVDSRLTIGNFSHSRQTEHSTCNHDSQNGFSHDHDSQGILKNSKSRVTKITLPPPPPPLINGLCPFHGLFRREHVALMVCDRFKQLVQDQSHQNITIPHVISRIREEARASINYVVNYSKRRDFYCKMLWSTSSPALTALRRSNSLRPWSKSFALLAMFSSCSTSERRGDTETEAGCFLPFLPNDPEAMTVD